jgi:hypothetical protein
MYVLIFKDYGIKKTKVDFIYVVPFAHAMKVLDIGCGKSKRIGAIGLDMNPALNGDVDVVHEIKSKVNLPFKDSEFNEIYLSHIIEHIQDIPWLMSELHRIAVPKGQIHIRFPHFSSRNAYGDVTHCHYLGFHSFDHFCPDTKLGREHQYHTFFGRNFPFKIENIRPGSRSIMLQALYDVMSMNAYEEVVAKIFPISEVNLELRVLK